MNKYLLFSLIILVHLTTYSQTTWYVSVIGNDTSNGLTENTAFATLQHAADIVSPGDSVLVLPGNYTGFDLRNGGNQNEPIVFRAIGNNVIIDNPNAVTNDGINIEEADWITVDGFAVENQPRAGIRIAFSDFVTIKNNI